MRPPPESGKIDQMSRRFQFSLRDLFLLMLGCGFYFLSLSLGGSKLSLVAFVAGIVIVFEVLGRR